VVDCGLGLSDSGQEQWRGLVSKDMNLWVT